MPLLHYDRGALELLGPSLRHVRIGAIVAWLVEVLAEEQDLKTHGVGHATFTAEGLQAGFEADGSFYFSSNAELAGGKEEIDLSGGEPPLDLVVEVDVSGGASLLDKLPIYARMGVPEVWRYADGRARSLGLRGEGYEALAESSFLPMTHPEVPPRAPHSSRISTSCSWWVGALCVPGEHRQ